MDRTLVGVVLAGGSGTRLYPASRSDRPKQLRSPTGERSLLGRALDRAAVADRRVVLTAPDHAETVREHVRELEDGDEVAVWVEPAPRDTGPALLYAAGRARATFEEPVLLCLPSDHHVAGDFASLAERAGRVASETAGLVCVGVEPDRPATGYGYVRPGRATDGYAPVEAFHEKPDADRARELLQEGALWNAGMFAWTPGALLSAARETPLSELADAVDPWPGDPDEAGSLADAYADLEPVSVDHAVMERAEHVYVVPAGDVEWDDLGTWDALARVLTADAEGTVTTGDVLAVDASESVLASDGDLHVAAVGVDDLVVAAYGDRVLVVPRGETDRVREVVARLRETGRF